jgi:hypothetical protein
MQTAAAVLAEERIEAGISILERQGFSSPGFSKPPPDAPGRSTGFITHGGSELHTALLFNG